MLICLAIFLTGCVGASENEYYDEALESMDAGDYEAAVAIFDKAIAADTRLAESYRMQGIGYLHLGDNAAAIASLSRSLNSLDVTEVEFKKDVMYYLAEARTKHGELARAIEVYTDIIAMGKDEKSLFLRGKLNLIDGHETEAKADFDKAIDGSRNYGLYLDIFNVYDGRRMSIEGQEYLSKALEIKPEKAADYYERGRIYYYMKDYNSAKVELMIAINDGNTEAILLLGKVYIAMEDISGAKAMYQEYLESGENMARAYNGLALCNIYEKNYDMALENIEKGLANSNDEERQELLFNEIVVYEYKLDFTTAKEKMAKYLALYPDDEVAIRENEFLQSR